MTSTDHRGVQLSRIAIVDLEASSLGSAGYPTEIGWAVLHDDGSIASGACLIRPASKWLLYDNAWSPASERLTGITMAMLTSDGLPPREALARFLAAVGDWEVYSDEPDFDAHWLGMLADVAWISVEVLKIDDAEQLIEQVRSTVAFGEAPRHRAEADARRLALALAEAVKPG